MKKVLLAGSILTLLSAPVLADDRGSYITGGAGWGFLENHQDDVVVGGAVGHDLGNVRGDVGYDAYLNDDLDGHLLSANVYLEKQSVDGPLTPFVGVGVGYLILDGANAGSNDEDLALIGTAGLRYNFTEQVGIEGSYRYVHSEAEVVDNGSASDFGAHTVMGRLSYRF